LDSFFSFLGFAPLVISDVLLFFSRMLLCCSVFEAEAFIVRERNF